MADAMFAVFRGEFLSKQTYMRVTLLTDEPPISKEDEDQLCHSVWIGYFQPSIERRQLVPKGVWMVTMFHPDVDYHDILDPKIAAQVDAGWRKNPNWVPISYALVDSEDLI